MTETITIATGYAVMAAIALALFAALLTWLWAQKKLTAVQSENSRLSAELEAERRLAVERRQGEEDTRRQLSDSFHALAAEALKSNSSEFLKLAQENLKQFQTRAEGDLAQREKAVANLVAPIREALDKTEQQIRQMEKERQAAYGSLTKHLETMAETQRLLQGETRNLVQALRRPEVRGQWGEMTLKRLAELAGMVQYCDFSEQASVASDAGGKLRPDMVVHMPDGRDIVVDAKTPLDAYLSAIEASDDNHRAQALERHARKVRERVRELSAKSYWQQFKNAPDFVVLFIPGDQFLSAALDVDHKLLEDALAERVILATPTSLVALLRAVGYGWRQEQLAENAEKIREEGERLYERLGTFNDYLVKLGNSLNSSVNNYNKAMGSFDARILPSARKFTEMGITPKKELGDGNRVEAAVRGVTSSGDE